MYAEALTFSGYRVITAADAQQALALARACRPELLVVDVRLPGKAGIETMRRLRAGNEFGGPILALTAHAFHAERDEIADHGFDAVLSKPCLPDALVAAVARALEAPADR
jgi:CheY-like chemotaxis protein